MSSRTYSDEYNPRVMSSKKVIFIIPGFRQRITSVGYRQLSKALKKEGYTPILVKITWRNSTISENTKHFLKVYKKNRSRKKYILGFSYGAMIAFIASTQVNTSGLILCSLSPYFSEDVSKLKNRSISTLMENRYRDFSKLHYATLAKLIKTRQVLMLYGRQETRSLIKRVREAFSEIELENKRLISIKEAEHNIAGKRYLYSITEAARNLL